MFFMYYIFKNHCFMFRNCLDNNVYFEFHPFVFYIKDLNTKALCKDGLYVFSEYFSMSIPQVYYHFVSFPILPIGRICQQK